MADNIGQIPEEVDALAADFEARAVDLESLQTAITNKLAATQWTGPDRDRFQADWEGVLSANVASAVTTLRGASALASQNAQEQRDASAS
jgi:hypothetical protein